jgi:hypothetical protein
LREQGDTLVVREVGAETVVYDPRTHRAHCLGRIAAAVWRQFDGRCDLRELTRRVGRSLSERIDEATVRLAVRRLRIAGMIAGPLPWSEDSRESRRLALRAVGAAAGLAVLSLAVPSPAQTAATCLPNGQPCAQSSQCCNNCCNPNAHRCTGGGPCLVP